MRKGLEDRVLWASMNNASGIGAEGEALASCHLPGDDSWQGKYRLVRERQIKGVVGDCWFMVLPDQPFATRKSRHEGGALCP